MFAFVTKNWELITAALAGLWVLLQFLWTQRAAAKRHRFESYHNMILRLVDGEQDASGVRVPRLDRQIALVFELRRYRSYRSVTTRILSRLRQQWAPDAAALRQSEMIAEIDRTLAHLRAPAPLHMWQRFLEWLETNGWRRSP